MSTAARRWAFGAALLSIVIGACSTAAAQPAPAGPKNVVRAFDSPKPSPGRRAVVIGVEDYEEFPDLEYCGDDAHWLSRHFSALGFQCTVLRNQTEAGVAAPTPRPVNANVQKILDSCLSAAGPDDSVIIAFSGHGIHVAGESYFCPADAKLENGKSQNMISVDDLYRRLQACPASLKLLLVDACRNDPSQRYARSFRARSDTDEDGLVQDLQNPPDGVLTLSSCSVGEISWEAPELGHGVFMHFLMEGLSGGAATRGRGERHLTLLRLYEYASEKTQEHVQRTQRRVQVPTLKGQLRGNPVLAEIPDGGDGSDVPNFPWAMDLLDKWLAGGDASLTSQQRAWINLIDAKYRDRDYRMARGFHERVAQARGMTIASLPPGQIEFTAEEKDRMEQLNLARRENREQSSAALWNALTSAQREVIRTAADKWKGPSAPRNR